MERRQQLGLSAPVWRMERRMAKERSGGEGFLFRKGRQNEGRYWCMKQVEHTYLCGAAVATCSRLTWAKPLLQLAEEEEEEEQEEEQEQKKNIYHGTSSFVSLDQISSLRAVE